MQTILKQKLGKEFKFKIEKSVTDFRSMILIEKLKTFHEDSVVNTKALEKKEKFTRVDLAKLNQQIVDLSEKDAQYFYVVRASGSQLYVQQT